MKRFYADMDRLTLKQVSSLIELKDQGILKEHSDMEKPKPVVKKRKCVKGSHRMKWQVFVKDARHYMKKFPKRSFTCRELIRELRPHLKISTGLSNSVSKNLSRANGVFKSRKNKGRTRKFSASKINGKR